jgi:hypothetical protein
MFETLQLHISGEFDIFIRYLCGAEAEPNLFCTKNLKSLETQHKVQ